MSTAAVATDWEIQDPDFSAEIAALDSVELQLSGSADISTRPRLEALIGKLHGRLDAEHARDVVVDMRQLEFMSAASFNALVGWLAILSELPPERRYRIRFRANPHILWQRRSLRALSCFATDVVSIET